MPDLVAALASLAETVGFSGVIRLDGFGPSDGTLAFGHAHRGFGIPNAPDTQFAAASGANAKYSKNAARAVSRRRTMLARETPFF